MAQPINDRNGIDQNVSELPIDCDIIFSDYENIYKKRVEKRQTKLLQKISFIKPFLEEGEKIFLVTTGCSPMSIMEQFTMRRSALYIKQSLFVFTNKRIFHIPTKSNYTYRNSIAQILYADCQTIEMNWRSLVVKYKNGKKEKFQYIPINEGQKIKELLKTIALEGVQSNTACRTHLCPRCTKELIEDDYTCPHCRLEFKNKAEARRFSIIYPGGGYFYTGHPWSGVVVGFIESGSLISVVINLVEALQGVYEHYFIVLIRIGFPLVMFALVKISTIYYSNLFIEEYIPKETEIKPIQ